jgi:ABC-type nitrate/sulfonate/bicarbonate transport system substrate-binding protein
MTKNLTAAALLGALLTLLAAAPARAQATGCDLGFLPTTRPPRSRR